MPTAVAASVCNFIIDQTPWSILLRSAYEVGGSNAPTVVDPSRLPLLLRRFRLAYIKAGCRQDWRVDEPLRQLSGETPEKRNDVGRILIAESPSELHLGHDSHRLRETVMEIGGVIATLRRLGTLNT